MPFPNPKDVQDQFWANIGFSFALVIIIGVLYPLANIIKALVQEKESKIREGMMMMALHGGKNLKENLLLLPYPFLFCRGIVDILADSFYRTFSSPRHYSYYHRHQSLPLLVTHLHLPLFHYFLPCIHRLLCTHVDFLQQFPHRLHRCQPNLPRY